MTACALDIITQLQVIAQSSNPYKTAITAGLSGAIKPGMLRGVYWRIYFGILPTPRSKPNSVDALLDEWEEHVHQLRKNLSVATTARQTIASKGGEGSAEEEASNKKKKTRFGDSDDDDVDEDVVKVNNPLSNHASSDYAKKFQRQKLEEVIEKDMGRLWSEDPFFESDAVKENMKDILSDFCCDDNDSEGHIAGYRQGMHEILSLVYYVIHKDAELVHSVKPKLSDLTEFQADSLSVMQAVCSLDAVKQDAHMVFSKIMSTHKGLGLVTWYHGAISSPKGSPQAADVGQGSLKMVNMDATDNVVVDVANNIQLSMVKQCDEALWRKLNKELEIHPTSYLLRWLRLLFIREFSFAQASIIWDAIFAEFSWRCCEEDEESSFSLADSIVPHVALSMLQFVATDLMESDFAYALRRLMRYPPVEDARPIVLRSIERRHAGSRIALIAGIFPHNKHNAPPHAQQPSTAVNGQPPAISPLQPPQVPANALPTSSGAYGSGGGMLPPPVGASGATLHPSAASVGKYPDHAASSPSAVAPPPPLAASFPTSNPPPPLHASSSTFGNGARRGFESESVTALRDKQIRQGMALASIVRRFETKWFKQDAVAEMTSEEKAQVDEDYIVAIAELKKVRDVLLNSVPE